MKKIYGSTAIHPMCWPAKMLGMRGTVYKVGILLMLGCFLAGCTTLKPIHVDAVTLHQEIRSGEIIKAGDTIRAITIDGVAHKLTVTAVDENVIKGRSAPARLDAPVTELAIDDIVRLEIGEFSGEKAGTFAKETGKGGLYVFTVAFIAGFIVIILLG